MTNQHLADLRTIRATLAENLQSFQDKWAITQPAGADAARCNRSVQALTEAIQDIDASILQGTRDANDVQEVKREALSLHPKFSFKDRGKGGFDIHMRDRGERRFNPRPIASLFLSNEEPNTWVLEPGRYSDTPLLKTVEYLDEVFSPAAAQLEALERLRTLAAWVHDGDENVTAESDTSLPEHEAYYAL